MRTIDVGSYIGSACKYLHSKHSIRIIDIVKGAYAIAYSFAFVVSAISKKLIDGTALNLAFFSVRPYLMMLARRTHKKPEMLYVSQQAGHLRLHSSDLPTS